MQHQAKLSEDIFKDGTGLSVAFWKQNKMLDLDPLYLALLWRHNGQDDVSNHQPHRCLRNCLFGHISKKTSKLRVTGLCAGNSPGTGEFPAHMASNAENVSIWWRHHEVSSMDHWLHHITYWSVKHTFDARVQGRAEFEQLYLKSTNVLS